MGNFKKVISLRQASQLSGYHQDYLSSLLRKNDIRGEKKGSNWFTTEEEIERYIFKQKIRNKKRIIKYVLLLFKKINMNVIYVFIYLVLFSVGVYFYNKVEMQASIMKPQFSNSNHSTQQFNRLQF